MALGTSRPSAFAGSISFPCCSECFSHPAGRKLALHPPQASVTLSCRRHTLLHRSHLHLAGPMQWPIHRPWNLRQESVAWKGLAMLRLLFMLEWDLALPGNAWCGSEPCCTWCVLLLCCPVQAMDGGSHCCSCSVASVGDSHVGCRS
jgi:hypothetical protein